MPKGQAFKFYTHWSRTSKSLPKNRNSPVPGFFFVTLYNVMVPGPAMSVASEDEFYTEFAFDFLFFVLIGVVLMNIVFGIIIDTFAALRDETQSRQENRCEPMRAG